MRKKKIELIDELKQAENLLLEKQEELLTCQDEVARLMGEQTATEANVLLDDELVSLKEELHEINATTERQKKELQKAESSIERLTQELEEARAVADRKKKASLTVPTSSYSFRLDIYPRSEETYQSRIEHLLSGERQPLDGLDLEAIVEFMGNYLKIERGKATPQQPLEAVALDVIPDESALSVPQPVLETQSGRNSAQAASRIVLRVQPRAVPAGDLITAHTPFQVQVESESNLEARIPSGRYTLSLYARNLETGASKLVGSLTRSLETLDGTTTRLIDAIGLPEGLYRIDAVTSFAGSDNTPLPISSINEGAFLQVI